MTERKRPYRMRERARAQEETRQRIVEATMQLHEELGPRNTTISAIAERAGVQRLTLYRHFPNERAVFQACTSHWLSLHPPPDPADWSGIANPRERFRAAIQAFYGYFTETRRMWTVSFRDVGDVPALREPMARVGTFMNNVAEDLIMAFGDAAEAAHIAPTIRHALHFLTWLELEEQGLSNEQKTGLVISWLQLPDHGAPGVRS
jgi:AcrR family transcriptional regulator